MTAGMCSDAISGGIANQDATLSSRHVPRASEGRGSRECPEAIAHGDGEGYGTRSRTESPNRRIVVKAIVLVASQMTCA
jgi:hypothetical protein